MSFYGKFIRYLQQWFCCKIPELNFPELTAVKRTNREEVDAHHHCAWFRLQARCHHSRDGYNLARARPNRICPQQCALAGISAQR
jgi:hypothetical protein